MSRSLFRPWARVVRRILGNRVMYFICNLFGIYATRLHFSQPRPMPWRIITPIARFLVLYFPLIIGYMWLLGFTLFVIAVFIIGRSMEMGATR